MKTIGLLGGMSWESTVTYYQEINREVARRLGGLHSASCLLYSVDFAPIEAMQRAGDWTGTGEVLAAAAQSLERGGAKLLVLCTNTMHKVADQIQEGVGIPLLHIADATADALLAAGVTKAGLLGTRYTMEQDFYTSRLERRGITVLTPPPPGRDRTDRVIFEELCRGRVFPKSQTELLQIAEDLQSAGAGGVVLGCTELGLLLPQNLTRVPLFDTTAIHARAAVEAALAEE